MVRRFETASSIDEAQAMLRRPGFNLKEDVVLNARPSESEAEALEKAPVGDNSTADIVRYEPDKVVIKAYAQHSGLLILTDTFYPGWRAEVDGKPTTIYQADGLVRAVYLGQGEHTIRFTYSPNSFKAGLMIAILSAVVLVVVFTMGRLRRRTAKDTTRASTAIEPQL
jgi:uncharacterized membrane protein YfhO